MLVPVPLVNQLTTATNDGQPSENARADCVAASCDAAAQAYGVARNTTPDWWKDSAYGQGYTGGTDPDHYAHAFASFGLAVQEWRNTDGWALVRQITSHLQAGHPVLGAIPSMWGLDYTGQDMVSFGASTHEITFCDDDGTTLTAMNPWGGFYHAQPHAWWAERLVYGRVNPVVRTASSMAWQRQPDGTGKDDRGHTCGTGCMYYLQQNGLTGTDGLMSETFFVPNQRAFLPLSGGRCLSVTHDLTAGQWIINENAAQVAVDLWNALQAARAQILPPTPPDANAAPSEAAMRALKAALELVH